MWTWRFFDIYRLINEYCFYLQFYIIFVKNPMISVEKVIQYFAFFHWEKFICSCKLKNVIKVYCDQTIIVQQVSIFELYLWYKKSHNWRFNSRKRLKFTADTTCSITNYELRCFLQSDTMHLTTCIFNQVSYF